MISPEPSRSRGSAETAWLQRLFATAVEAAHPAKRLPALLPGAPYGRTVVVGAGKAAAAMAEVVDQHWRGALSGLVVTRYGHGMPCGRIEVVEAAHPVPDRLGVETAQRMRSMVGNLQSGDLVLALISGGGSALLSLPAPGITLQEKQAISTALLRSGAPIRAINTVRQHLSAIKGGRLAAAAHPARVISYVISDVPGDDPALVASGPTIPAATTPADALAVLDRYRIPVPVGVRAHLARNSAPALSLEGAFANDEVIVLATAADALAAAADHARRQGVEVRILGNDIEGEARAAGREHALRALAERRGRSRPLLLLSGGETSVTVRGTGRGGRNTEYLLSLLLTLDGAPGIHALAADTDGIDGSEDNAGAVCGPDSLSRARALGLSATALLEANDAYAFFQRLDDLIVTGPTRTNVNDFRALLVTPEHG